MLEYIDILYTDRLWPSSFTSQAHLLVQDKCIECDMSHLKSPECALNSTYTWNTGDHITEHHHLACSNVWELERVWVASVLSQRNPSLKKLRWMPEPSWNNKSLCWRHWGSVAYTWTKMWKTLHCVTWAKLFHAFSLKNVWHI